MMFKISECYKDFNENMENIVAIVNIVFFCQHEGLSFDTRNESIFMLCDGYQSHPNCKFS